MNWVKIQNQLANLAHIQTAKEFNSKANCAVVNVHDGIDGIDVGCRTLLVLLVLLVLPFIDQAWKTAEIRPASLSMSYFCMP